MLISCPNILYMLTVTLFPVSLLLMLKNTMYIIEWEICSMMTSNIKLDIMFDWSGLIYSSTIMFISGNVLKFSKEYMKHDPNKLRFTYIVLLFITSMNMLIFIPNMMCLLIGWDGLGITSFILVIYYNNPRSLSAGTLTILVNRLGDTFLLMAIASTLNTGDWLILHNTMNTEHSPLQWTGILVAAMTKSAQMPFSSWLPAAMAAPTPVSTLVHSSTLVTGGTFILYRFNNLVTSSTNMQTILILTGTMTMLTASTCAIYENDMKKIIALSTLSQLGFMIMTIGMNMPLLTFFHMTAHAMFKALLFLCAGTMIHMNNNNQDLRLYGQFSTLSPAVFSPLMVSTMALMALPYMSGYYSKHTILEWSHSMTTNIFLLMLMLLTVLLTSCYTLRLVTLMTTLPSTHIPTHLHLSNNNNNTPLITMSVASITSGATLQWMVPLTSMQPTITEKFETSISNHIILISSLTILFLTMKTNQLNKMSQLLNDTFSSLMFMHPTSTQLMLQLPMKLSMQLYKHLDQSWLEKLISFGLPQKMMTLGTHTHLMFFSFTKNTLMTTFSFTVFMMLLFYLNK